MTTSSAKAGNSLLHTKKKKEKSIINACRCALVALTALHRAAKFLQTVRENMDPLGGSHVVHTGPTQAIFASFINLFFFALQSIKSGSIICC